jgi:Flp pilus assembly protein TadD
MNPCRQTISTLLLTYALSVSIGAQQQPPASEGKPSGPLAEAQQKMREGRHSEALAICRKVLAETPDSYQAHNQAGVALDLLGQYEEARTHFAKAIELALEGDEKSRAMRNMAMSYAFTGDCAGATKYQASLFDQEAAAGKMADAGGVANELARVCLESGNFDSAEAWYKKGYDAALKAPGLSAAQKDLWEFRWEHAQARIAARRGQAADARKHVAAAKAILDKGTNPEQAPFFPYLAGYVAFYADDYKTAATELAKANQEDPFIVSLLAQAHEKLGDTAKATELYKKALTSNAHNLTNAFARPLARKKVG